MTTPVIDDDLWQLFQPLLPTHPRCYRYPGRRRLNDRTCLEGILYVLATGIAWEDLPQQLGYPCGMTCWRRLRDWNQAGVFGELHQLSLAKLHRAEQLGWSRAVIDAAHVRALKGGRPPPQARSTVADRAASTTLSVTPMGSHWRSA